MTQNLSITVFLRIGFFFFCSLGFGIANAQTIYPNRTIQTIMPLQAGSGVDLLYRPIAQKMAENLGQAITIENIPGGAGLIGTAKVAQSPAEGYVLGAFNDSILTMLPNLYKKIDFRTMNFLIAD